jgi:hypothetical protein
VPLVGFLLLYALGLDWLCRGLCFALCCNSRRSCLSNVFEVWIVLYLRFDVGFDIWFLVYIGVGFSDVVG